jgi:hypothetical protein
MKKLLVIMMVFLAFSMPVQAKENSGFRIQGGIGFSTMYYSPDANSYRDIKKKAKVAGFVGVGYELRVAKIFAIQPEINYLNRGAVREFTNILTNQRVKMTMNLHTIEIPILLKLCFGKHFNIYSGPYIGFNLAASAKSNFYDASGKEIGQNKGVNIMKSKYNDVDNNKAYKRVDVGVDLGLEVVIVKGFFIGARVTQGFLDLTNDKYKGYVGSDAVILPGDGRWVGSTSANLYTGYRF